MVSGDSVTRCLICQNSQKVSKSAKKTFTMQNFRQHDFCPFSTPGNMQNFRQHDFCSFSIPGKKTNLENRERLRRRSRLKRPDLDYLLFTKTTKAAFFYDFSNLGRLAIIAHLDLIGLDVSRLQFDLA